MVPFRVFHRENKELWIVLNYHPGTAPNDDGSYLLAKDDDSDKDGEMAIISAQDLKKYKLVDFLEDDLGYDD
jgi:hypothetical protein